MFILYKFYFANDFYECKYSVLVYYFTIPTTYKTITIPIQPVILPPFLQPFHKMLMNAYSIKYDTMLHLLVSYYTTSPFDVPEYEYSTL